MANQPNIENFVTLYHCSTEDALAKIRKEGLLPFFDLCPEQRGGNDSVRGEIDLKFNEFAPIGLDRQRCIYAWLSKEDGEMNSENTWSYNRDTHIFLPVKVDIDKALVADVSYVTSVFNAYLLSEYVRLEFLQKNIRNYWSSALILKQFLSLTPEEKSRIKIPEVLIPGPISPEFIEFPNGEKTI